MNGESSSSKKTPIKPFQRDVRGLLSLQQDSPGRLDEKYLVLWNSWDSPRVVGGRSKSLKSSNQLTPKQHVTKKKYYSSPILVPRATDSNNDKKNLDKEAENKRILEEFQRQFCENYVPRNLMDNLTENLEDSITVPDAALNGIKDNELELSDHDYRISDEEDLAILAEIEAEEQRFLDNVVKKDVLVSHETQAVPTLVPETQVNQYFDSDDDDIVLSIPIEKLTGVETKNGPVNGKKPVSDVMMSSRESKHENCGVPAKRESNVVTAAAKTRNLNSSTKPIVSEPAVHEPLAKKRCTAEEIAEKRRQAMMRREEFLRSQKATHRTNRI